jgi:hypothetical protein
VPSAADRSTSKSISPPARNVSTNYDKIQKSAIVFLEGIYLWEVLGLRYLDQSRAGDAPRRRLTQSRIVAHVCGDLFRHPILPGSRAVALPDD